MPKPKVLIVEDDSIIFKELVVLFESMGYEVISESPNKAVDTYDAAVALLQTHKPNLAVLDIELKGGAKDGLDLGHYIKKRFGIVVFLFTGHSTATNRYRTDAIEAEGFILKTKPINYEQLCASVDAARTKILALPPPHNPGIFLKVRKWPDAFGKEEHPEDLYEHTRYIWYNELPYVKTYGPDGAIVKNSIFLYTAPAVAYLYRSTMEGMMEKLPRFFEFANQAAIVNICRVDRYHIHTNAVLINGERFEIGRTYKERLLQKISEFLGDLP